VDLPFVPMLLSRVEAPFADPGWLFQVKWDGVRNLTWIEGGRIRHWSRRLRDRTHLFPEFADLARALGPGRYVLDGEIIVLKEGKPSFQSILERDTGSGASPARIQRAPATLILFDLLEQGGRELYRVPVEERLARLAEALPSDERWQAVQSFPGDAGPDLWQAVLDQGLEGVVAKRLGSGYQPGIRSQDWLKIKRKQEMLAAVVGYTNPPGRQGGLLLGAYQDGRLKYIGRSGSGISAAQWQVIREHLPPGPCPFDRLPSLTDRFGGPPGPVVWTQLGLTVRVQFTEWTEQGRLRDPVVIGFSDQGPEDGPEDARIGRM
jgi:bifunctional non-homologous end joining protein LigD